MQPVAQQPQGTPATVDEAEEDQTSQASVSDTEAHVVIFVHGFRVCQINPVYGALAQARTHNLT